MSRQHTMTRYSTRFGTDSRRWPYEYRWWCNEHQRWVTQRFRDSTSADLSPHKRLCNGQPQSVPEAQAAWEAKHGR